ncbi:MAG TPA: Flp family type IVb pilin [Parvularcula sp.]|nr:Flp family type IVb pilin [Parvularcula sp.]HBS32857.1 Flp family type IVb pilin [Parvularcula sp.]HBS33526.1 Flp family type IVb pilin [Parvularcula sp.]
MICRKKKIFRAFARDKSGATAIEYSLIVGLIFLAIVTSVNSFASKTDTMYSEIASAMRQ